MAEPARSIDDQIAEVAREIALRKNVYPGFVKRSKMREDEAAEHIARMEAALTTLKWCRDHRELILSLKAVIEPTETADG